VVVAVLLARNGDDAADPDPTSSPTSAAPAASVDASVYVVNASGVSGAATQTVNSLTDAGFAIAAEPGDGPSASDTTIVYFLDPSTELLATRVAAFLDVPLTQVQPLPDPPPFDVPGDAGVAVALGSDVASR
jgi:hypothetical protein